MASQHAASPARRPRRRSAVAPLVGALVAVLLLAACSDSGDGAEHGSGAGAPQTTRLLLTGSDAVLGVTDLGDKGPTPGDVRTLSLTMTSPDGATTGRAEIVQTLTRLAGGTATALKSVVINLSDGSIMAMGTTEFTDFLSDTGRPNDTTEKIAIVGGDGAYRGASGAIDIVVLPKFQSQWILSITVD